MSADEFTIRVTGAAPPPLRQPAPSVKNKGNKGRGGGLGKTGNNNNAAPQQQRRYNLRLRPSSSLDQLRTNVFALFSLPSNSVESYQLSFLGGFPPKELDPVGKRTVHELGIRPNESLIVKFSLLSGAGVKDGKGKTAKKGEEKKIATKKSSSESKEAAAAETPESSYAVSNTGRPRRASAMAATASFRDVIASQDAILKKEKKPKKKAAIAIGGLSNANKRIATYNTGAAAAASRRPKKVRMEGTGYRLSDGKSLAGSPSKKGSESGKRKSQKPLFESKDDIASTLLSSLNSSGQGGNIGKFLRMAMKGAVEKSYEASRAGVRVAAVSQGDFSFERVKGGSVVDGGGVVLGTASDHVGTADVALGRTLYTVAYSKMMEGRGKYEEQVEIIGLAALKGVLESVYNAPPSKDADGESDGGGENTDGKEILRPVSIAQQSPRVFWSLVYHSCEAAKNEQSPSLPSVEDMLQSMMPNLDWTYLGRGGRKRQLSEKARDNLRQKKQEAAQHMMQSSSRNNEEGVKEIEEMEEYIMNAVMPDGGDDGKELNERERRARAAMSRFGKVEAAGTSSALLPANYDIADEWMLVTPTEDDIDELIECIMEAEPFEPEGRPSENYDEEAAKVWAGTLLDSVRNWRELANCNLGYILSKLKQGTNANLFVPTSDTVQKWIDYAQARSLEEIMLEIVDGDQDALELLQDKAKSSSPRDLRNWHSAPGMLLDVMVSGTEEPCKRWGKVDVMRWVGRAKTALGVCAWLELFTSSDFLDS